MKKIVFAVILAAIAALLFACGGSGAKEDTKKDDRSEIGESDEKAAEKEGDKFNIPDNLPDMNFEGYNFRIYLENEKSTEHVYAETDIGEVVNDAVYRANLSVEERFNVKINPVFYGDIGKVKPIILAGDDAFDIISGHDISMGSMSLENVFLNLYNVPNLNFDNPWWPKNTVKSLTLMKDKMYLFSNHISLFWLDNTRVMFMNKNKFAELGYSLPYQDVFDGTWTFGRFFDMVKDAYSDQNGNGERDDEDFYGFVKSDGEAYCYLESWGIQVTLKDDSEILKINAGLPEIIPSILNKMYDLLFVVPGGYQTKNEYELPNNIFAAGNSLFLFKELSNIRNSFKDIAFDCGILPMPKMDGQSEYYAGYTDRPYAVPATAQNLERTGIIIEAMSAEGYKQVLPAYYEIALKVKYTYDDESVRVLDIITQSGVLDFWYVYGGYDSENMIWCLPGLLKNSKPSTDFASYYEKMEGIQQKRINKVIAAIQEMN